MKITYQTTSADFTMLDKADSTFFESTKVFSGNLSEKQLIKRFSELANFSGDIVILEVNNIIHKKESIDLTPEEFYRMSTHEDFMESTTGCVKRKINIKKGFAYIANTDSMTVVKKEFISINKTEDEAINEIKIDLCFKNDYFVKADFTQSIDENRYIKLVDIVGA